MKYIVYSSLPSEHGDEFAVIDIFNTRIEADLAVSHLEGKVQEVGGEEILDELIVDVAEFDEDPVAAASEDPLFAKLAVILDESRVDWRKDEDDEDLILEDDDLDIED